jgi:hypothetical protein
MYGHSSLRSISASTGFSETGGSITTPSSFWRVMNRRMSVRNSSLWRSHGCTTSS